MLRHHAPSDCRLMSVVVCAHRGQRCSQSLWGTWPTHARERGSHHIAFAMARLEMLDKGDIIRVCAALAMRGEIKRPRYTPFLI
jgi:hypothetical protein